MNFAQTLFKTGFTDLSFLKKWMVRLSVAGLLGGALVQGYTMLTDSGGGRGISWSALSLKSGVGFLGGFIIGVAARIFFKVTALVGIALAALGWGLQKMGWVDLPWDSFGEISEAFARAVSRNTDRFQDFLESFLPAGVTTAVGLGSGVTQKPQFDDDSD